MPVNELARYLWNSAMNFIKRLLYKIGLIKPKPAQMFYFDGTNLIPIAEGVQITAKPKKRPRLYKQANVVTNGEIK
jgi:hypothetical protein